MPTLSQLRNHFVFQRILFPLRQAYIDFVWWIFGLVAPLLLKKGERASVVSSVLHVSCLSHKPYMLSRLMREHGIASEYLAIGAEKGWLKVGNKGYDHNLRGFPWSLLTHPFDAIWALFTIMRRYDVIHYHFISLITPNGQELRHLKRMGKLIVFHFRGCDLRQKSRNFELNPGLNCCQECDYPDGSCDHAAQHRKLALARAYGDVFLVTTPDLRDFFPEATHVPFIAPYGVDMSAVVAVSREPEIFRVVTSSNHAGVDGVAYVRTAVERLRSEGKAIELVEVRRTPFEQALAIYKSADVFVGKLLMGYYNNANIECMLLGVPCLSYIRPEYLDAIPDCPIVATRPDEVEDRLRYYMDHRNELADLGRRGPAYVAARHDPATVLTIMLMCYRNGLRNGDSGKKEGAPAR